LTCRRSAVNSLKAVDPFARCAREGHAELTNASDKLGQGKLGQDKLRQDALAIWQAGVEAVTPARLFRDKVTLDGTVLCVDEIELDLASIGRLWVVGAGKASAAMATALQQTVLHRLPSGLGRLPVCGWINVPADTFTASQAAELGTIQLHAARPAGLNWPTEQAVAGTQQILHLVRQAHPQDLVICLLSGGGSALLVAPPEGITLADKQAVAREIAAAGGNIEQLNTVRRALSEVKGGGLARACGAARMLTLVVSDVLGDPLETIASGPTLVEASASPQAALHALEQLGLLQCGALVKVVHYLEQQASVKPQSPHQAPQRVLPLQAAPRAPSTCHVDHVILGNNADAIDAAGVKAVELGYRYVMQGARHVEGDVLQVAQTALAAIEQLQGQAAINCWISGGEPTVNLPAEGCGKGGRNQQLALAVLQHWQTHQAASPVVPQRPVVFVSGGTDGEDGPTDAAGAWIDGQTLDRARSLGLNVHDFLKRADAYHFFERVGGLLHTGPTGTNVCDLRVALVGQ
jgi:glycerate 2-kinase